MRFFLLCCTLLTALLAGAENFEVNKVKYYGSFPYGQTVNIGSVAKGVSDPLTLEAFLDDTKAQPITLTDFGNFKGENMLHIVAFDVEARDFVSLGTEIAGDSIKESSVTIAGRSARQPVKLRPGTYRAIVKFATHSPEGTNLKITLSTDSAQQVTIVDDGSRLFTLDDVIYGKKISRASMSADGNYFIVDYSQVAPNNRTEYSKMLYDARTLKPIGRLANNERFMPRSDRYYYYFNEGNDAGKMAMVDIATGQSLVIDRIDGKSAKLISPTENFMIIDKESSIYDGPTDVYRVIEPDDRMAGTRSRSIPHIIRFDQPSVLTPLVEGAQKIRTLDISDDGTKALMHITKRRLSKRPTTVFTIISLDLNTLKADTVVADDGFVDDAYYSPDGKMVVVKGSPEAFGRIGCTLPASVTPSTYDSQLFFVDLADKSVRPMTRDFTPSVNTSEWNRYDNQIYIVATDRDFSTLYKLDPKSGKITRVPTADCVVKGISMAVNSPLMLVWGQSDTNPDRIYCYNVKTGKQTLVDMPMASLLENMRLATVHDFNYLTSRGDSVYARFYLPDNFDPSKRYPMIVNYYGGCSPSTRAFDNRYPMNLYAAQDYVMLQINPSGCTGFGQEWSSRHVATAGKGVAEDIIEGVKQFCDTHSFVDPTKIGCIGASYGGFMTQYLLTQTDIFAAGVSHAGISDHTSYWGEGYWGYSYSETSMGEEKPWSNPDLYVKQSPLYNADKIHTPLLLIHGDADTNVPPGESIQMFNALQLLGTESALVLVEGQNHHILDPEKRAKWQDTIFAWFAKYLKDDPRWWDDMYPPQELY